jgi:hypothetical protein
MHDAFRDGVQPTKRGAVRRQARSTLTFPSLLEAPLPGQQLDPFYITVSIKYLTGTNILSIITMPLINMFVRGPSRVNTPPIPNNRDIEMDDLGRGTPPPPPPDPVAPLVFKKNGPWFALLIAFTLLFTTVGLHAPIQTRS